LLHGWGIELGLEVEAFPIKGGAGSNYEQFIEKVGPLPPDVRPEDGTWLVVMPGYALNPTGDEVYVPCPIFLNTAEELEGAIRMLPADCRSHLNPKTVDFKGKGIYYLVVEAYEIERHPVVVAGNGCGKNPEQFEFSRIKDTLRFRLILKEEIRPAFEHDADHRKLLNGRIDRNYICLGSIMFASGKPSVANENRETLLPEPEPTSTQAPQSCESSELLNALLTGDTATKLRKGFEVVGAHKTKLGKAFRVCLREEGIRQLSEGLYSKQTLDRISASCLLYGEPNPKLDAFFKKHNFTVSGLLRGKRIPELIETLKKCSDGESVHRGELLESALRAAAVTCELVRQWPASS
jgi:hypothetical protein